MIIKLDYFLFLLPFFVIVGEVGFLFLSIISSVTSILLEGRWRRAVDYCPITESFADIGGFPPIVERDSSLIILGTKGVCCACYCYFLTLLLLLAFSLIFSGLGIILLLLYFFASFYAPISGEPYCRPRTNSSP